MLKFDFLSKSDKRNYFYKKTEVEKIQFQFTFWLQILLECAFFMTKLPFRYSKFFYNFDRVFFEILPFSNLGLYAQWLQLFIAKIISKKIMKNLKYQLDTPKYLLGVMI